MPSVLAGIDGAPTEIGINPPEGMESMPATMAMDLRSKKMLQWLSLGRRVGLADCMACCVRG